MSSVQKIVPNLWFNGVAGEATHFYTGLFAGAAINHIEYYPTEGLLDFQKPLAGKPLVVDFTIAGYEFMAINAGAEFKPTPAQSFMVYFNPVKDSKARDNLQRLWDGLAAGGTVLMPLQKYDWSEFYGWVQDRYGYSWQLIMLEPQDQDYPSIVPAMMFGGVAQNRAQEAHDYYLDVFEESMTGVLQKYPVPNGPATADSLMYSDIKLAGQWFAISDSGVTQDFTFTEAVSYVVNCQDQNEIDYFWSKLSAYPESEQCGWCKDKFGISWQIVPDNMAELMKKPKAFETLLGQKKIVITDY